ncbi:Uncharacterized protein dnm_017310 [Desulfonema magnum]|uniref:Uncharacterized protein n=1 Tax=Desulfonema magnum TaxID=45655 RepID=A0A975BHP4_9BACT|nr:Uncharacterized protein dnm_017310 [Desulfonema magnum]
MAAPYPLLRNGFPKITPDYTPNFDDKSHAGRAEERNPALS